VEEGEPNSVELSSGEPSDSQQDELNARWTSKSR
jgi:hypothetical protein